MADHTFESLSKKKIDDLRAIAKELEHEAVQGFTQLRKNELIVALCKALGIDAQAHHHVVGVDKGAIKEKIAALKVERDAALEAKDSRKLKITRRKIHRLKHKLRAATI